MQFIPIRKQKAGVRGNRGRPGGRVTSPVELIWGQESLDNQGTEASGCSADESPELTGAARSLTPRNQKPHPSRCPGRARGQTDWLFK